LADFPEVERGGRETGMKAVYLPLCLPPFPYYTHKGLFLLKKVEGWKVSGRVAFLPFHPVYLW
jgi:hypothetical protein